MILSDAAVTALKEHGAKPFAQNVHVEDLTVYNQGLTDGTRILAEWVLSQLKPEAPVAASAEKESE